MGLRGFSHPSSGISMVQEKLSAGFRSLIFEGANRLLDGIGKLEPLWHIGKIPEGLFKWKIGVEKKVYRRESEKKIPRSHC